MADMRRHGLNRVSPTNFQKRFIAGSIKLQDGRTELEPLGPFGPAAGCVFPVFGKNRVPWEGWYSFSMLLIFFTG